MHGPVLFWLTKLKSNTVCYLRHIQITGIELLQYHSETKAEAGTITRSRWMGITAPAHTYTGTCRCQCMHPYIRYVWVSKAFIHSFVSWQVIDWILRTRSKGVATSALKTAIHCTLLDETRDSWHAWMPSKDFFPFVSCWCNIQLPEFLVWCGGSVEREGS